MGWKPQEQALDCRERNEDKIFLVYKIAFERWWRYLACRILMLEKYPSFYKQPAIPVRMIPRGENYFSGEKTAGARKSRSLYVDTL